MTSSIEERVLRTERVDVGMFGVVGWLTLTNQRLVLSRKGQLGQHELWSVPISSIESVRAKKAAGKGVDVLETVHRSATGEREHKSVYNPHGFSRTEQNSFDGFEQAILAAREAWFAPPPAPPPPAPPPPAPRPPESSSDVAAQLERVAELHRAGVLNDEEFAAAKAASSAEGHWSWTWTPGPCGPSVTRIRSDQKRCGEAVPLRVLRKPGSQQAVRRP
ncbi:MAG: hypothetical protein ACLQHS_00845 [Candidatus Limnocylindrales bacterium]